MVREVGGSLAQATPHGGRAAAGCTPRRSGAPPPSLARNTWIKEETDRKVNVQGGQGGR